MGQKTIRFSDLSEKLITDDGDLVRIVVREHPELDGQAVEFDGHRDEVQSLLGDALQVAEVELYFPGEDEPRRLIVDTAVFDQLATTRTMPEVLIAAAPAKRTTSARATCASSSFCATCMLAPMRPRTASRSAHRDFGVRAAASPKGSPSSSPCAVT